MSKEMQFKFLIDQLVSRLNCLQLGGKVRSDLLRNQTHGPSVDPIRNKW